MAPTGFWVSSKGGPLGKDEMALLQGIDVLTTSLMGDLGIGETVFGGMLGDAMSLNVLCNLLPRVLVAGGFATEQQAKRMKENSGW